MTKLLIMIIFVIIVMASHMFVEWLLYIENKKDRKPSFLSFTRSRLEDLITDIIIFINKLSRKLSANRRR